MSVHFSVFGALVSILISILVVTLKHCPHDDVFFYSKQYPEMLKAYIDICKLIITLSSGTVLLIVGTTEKLFIKPKNPEFLIISIGFFLATIMSMAVYLITSTRSYEISRKMSQAEKDVILEMYIESIRMEQVVQLTDEEIHEKAIDMAQLEGEERIATRKATVRNIILPSYAFTLFGFGYINVVIFFYFQFFG
jgi:hypothetical protein